MADELFQTLLGRAKAGEATHQPPFLMKDIAHGKLPTPQLFFVSCADARADPANIFKLNPGEAPVARVAGGRVDGRVLHSFEIMGTLVNIGKVVIIHHTDCGGLFTTDQEISSRLSDRAPQHAHLVDGKVFGAFKHIGLDECIREDVARFKAWPFLPKDAVVVGYAYEVETGKLREVVGEKD